MNDSTHQRINLSRLAGLLKHTRRRLNLSLKQLSLATGISRRTLARLESGYYESRSSPALSEAEGLHGARPSSPHRSPATDHRPRLSPRITMRLIRLLLPSDRIDAILSDATRLSRSLGDEPLDRFLDLVYDYPAFLFHQGAAEALTREDPAFARQVTRDYRNTFLLLLRSGFGTRNLGRRLRAFRLRHDLTLVDTAALLEISQPQLYHIETGQRRPSPRSRYRILRLLTLPVSLEEMQRLSRATPRDTRHLWLEITKTLLSLPPPHPPEFAGDSDRLHRLRYLWLTGNASTKSLAAQLGISPRHLLRLLRGERKPRRKLRERIARLVG